MREIALENNRIESNCIGEQLHREKSHWKAIALREIALESNCIERNRNGNNRIESDCI